MLEKLTDTDNMNYLNHLRKFVKNCNPFVNEEQSSKVEYSIQKVLAFILIFELSAILMDGVIILFFSVLGYDMLHGELPEGIWVRLLPFYGYVGFGLLTILYVKVIEKKLSQIKLILTRKSLGLFTGYIIMGAAMVAFMLTMLSNFGLYDFKGIGEINSGLLFASFLAYFIQGTTEEIMCRGFLYNTLETRLGIIPATVLSTIAFMAPHVLTIMEMDGFLAIIALINLCLVSVLFTLVMRSGGSVLSACGLHIGWNFMLGVICGLQVSGGTSEAGLLFYTLTGSSPVLTGGEYGIEASILLIPLLLTMNIFYIFLFKRKGAAYGISQEIV